MYFLLMWLKDNNSQNAALTRPLPNHAYRLQAAESKKMDTTRLALIHRELFDKFPSKWCLLHCTGMY